MPSIYPMPCDAPSIIINVTETSQTFQMANSGANNFVVVKNIGTNPIFITLGNSAITSTYPTAGMWVDGTIIAVGEISTYSKDYLQDGYFSVICGSGLTSQIVVQVGQGV